MSLLFFFIKFFTFSCAHTKQSLDFFVKIFSKQDPWNRGKSIGKEKKEKNF
jgi:hypothetical protein